MNKTKKCCKCKEIKSLDEFPNNKNNKDGKHSRCKQCRKIYNEENKENILKYYKQYRTAHTDYVNKYNKIWNEENKDKIRKYNKKYNQEHKVNPEYRYNYRKGRFRTDPLFKLKHYISVSIFKSFRANNIHKKNKTTVILGCSISEFKQYIESQFEPWMNWDNHGKYNGELDYGWDLDHMTPISSAKTEEELYKLNYYTNFQPLCSKVNRDIKRNNIIQQNIQQNKNITIFSDFNTYL